MADKTLDHGAPPSAWLWGVVAATAAFVVLTLIGLATTSFGFAFVALAPFVCGMIIGRWVRAARVMKTFCAFIAVGSVILGAATANLAGVICGVVFGVIASVPLLAGVFLGSVLAGTIRTGGSIASVAIVALLIPLEHTAVPPAPVESVSTLRTVDMTPSDVFERITFYEDTSEEPPTLLRIALPRPIRTLGPADKVGDRPRCIYDSGFIVKEVTRVDRPRLYAFRVIEQVGVESHAVELKGGSFDVSRVDGRRTRVKLTTTYRPRLSARVAWRPFEHAVVHALHKHVLEAMFPKGSGNAS